MLLLSLLLLLPLAIYLVRLRLHEGSITLDIISDSSGLLQVQERLDGNEYKWEVDQIFVVTVVGAIGVVVLGDARRVAEGVVEVLGDFLKVLGHPLFLRQHIRPRGVGDGRLVREAVLDVEAAAPAVLAGAT